MGNYQQAIVTYDKVLTIDPNDAYAIGGMAESLYGSGQHKQAIEWINKVLELETTNTNILPVTETLKN
jgi:tetratricopeptide (TPR) repeat protein